LKKQTNKLTNKQKINKTLTKSFDGKYKTKLEIRGIKINLPTKIHEEIMGCLHIWSNNAV
jgi:hypothetical protein